jgi:hypothetical protein
MYRVSFLFSVLLSLTINAKAANKTDLNLINPDAFINTTNMVLQVEDIKVIELEEPVEINFDTAQYLPKDFNALAGKNDIDWSKVELVELEEDVDLGFDPKAYLPKNFNALEGKNDIDWSKVELVELEEDVELNFDTKGYLPENFNPYYGMDSKEM